MQVLLVLLKQRRYTEGEALARELTTHFAQNGVCWKALGVMLLLQGKHAEAVEPMQKAAGFLPGDAETHSNLGVTLRELNRLPEAEASLRRALIIKPDYAEAHNNLGNVFQEQGRLPEAEACYRKALSLKPGYAEAQRNLENTLRIQERLPEAQAGRPRAVSTKSDSAETYGNLGNMLHGQGRLSDAEACYRQALSLKPDYFEAYCNLGVTLQGLGRLPEAEASLRQALIIKPDSAETHNNLGVALKEQGRLSEAEASLRQALSLKPDYLEAHCNLGVTLQKLGRLPEAEASLRLALIIKPDSAETCNNLGVALKEQGRLSEAEASLRLALSLKPDYLEAHCNLGNIVREQGRLSEAEACYRHALSLKPDYVEGHNNLGNALREQGRLSEAEACYRHTLSLKSDYVEAQNNLGVVLQEQGWLPEAEACCRQALSIKPDSAEAYNNLGIILREQGRLAEAEACYRQTLSLKPDYLEAHNNLGVALQELGRLSEAEVSLRRALSIKPDYGEAYSNLLFAMSYAPGHRTSHYFEEASRYGQMVAKKVDNRFSAWQCVPRPERLRVGLVSGDLHNHPVGYFLENVLAQIDSSRFEIIAYSTNHKADDLTARIKPCFSAWKSLIGLPDKAAADVIHADGIHVLLDCSGHTGKNRLPVFAWKPAPVQVSWPGYFATTGVAEMDYLVGDPYVTPAGEAGHFTETVWQLPETYLCFTPPDVPLEVGPLPALSSNSVTFGSFNNLTKMNDAVVTLWAKVLQAVPHSRLFLKAGQLNDPGVHDATRRRFAACGITPDRLILEGSSPRAKMLEAYDRLDIILAPFPYPGGTTSVEGLWMGVPAITRRGDSFLSHIGESIAHNAGLADWIAENDDDYVAKAIMYATDLGRLAALRNTLREKALASPLFDASRFARHLEAALWGMWERRQGH